MLKKPLSSLIALCSHPLTTFVCAGAHYFDNTSLKEKEDDVVQPNGEHVYYWETSSNVSPQSNDPNCLTYTYISHEHFVGDFNSGLIGALLICKPGKKQNVSVLSSSLSLHCFFCCCCCFHWNLPRFTLSKGSLDESGNQIGVHHEYVFLFGVFDENESKYKQSSYASDSHVKYTINGYAEGSLPGEYASPPSFHHSNAGAANSLTGRAAVGCIIRRKGPEQQQISNL